MNRKPLSTDARIPPIWRQTRKSYKCLRVSIAVIFIWFGSLKVFGYNPVQGLVAFSVFPSLGSGNGLFILGAAEVIIGILILANSFLALTYSLLLLHLLGTFSTFIFGWEVVFVPYFPILSLSGEFVVKNLTLIMAGLVVLVHENRRVKLRDSWVG